MQRRKDRVPLFTRVGVVAAILGMALGCDTAGPSSTEAGNLAVVMSVHPAVADRGDPVLVRVTLINRGDTPADYLSHTACAFGVVLERYGVDLTRAFAGASGLCTLGIGRRFPVPPNDSLVFSRIVEATAPNGTYRVSVRWASASPTSWSRLPDFNNLSATLLVR